MQATEAANGAGSSTGSSSPQSSSNMQPSDSAVEIERCERGGSKGTPKRSRTAADLESDGDRVPTTSDVAGAAGAARGGSGCGGCGGGDRGTWPM